MTTPHLLHERIVTEIGRDRYLELYEPRIRAAVIGLLLEVDPLDFAVAFAAFADELAARAPEPWQSDVRDLIERAAARSRN
jgi:hypothetical protein